MDSWFGTMRVGPAKDPCSHQGHYGRLGKSGGEPPTAQRPHPPIWMGAGGESSVRRVAERGYNLLLGQYSSPADVARSVAAYKTATEAPGRPFDPLPIGVTRASFVADNPPQKAPAPQ